MRNKCCDGEDDKKLESEDAMRRTGSLEITCNLATGMSLSATAPATVSLKSTLGFSTDVNRHTPYSLQNRKGYIEMLYHDSLM